MEVEATNDLVVQTGAGEAVELRGLGVVFKVSGEQTGGAFSIVEHPIAPRYVVPPHVHAKEDELSFVIEGEMGARQGDAEVRLGPGGYLVKPRGILHSFWNPTDEPARILEVISPAGFERYFAELGEYVGSVGEGPPDPARIAEIAGRYDLSFDLTWLPDVVQKHGLKPPF